MITKHNNFFNDQLYHIIYSRHVPYDICGGMQDTSSWCAPSVGAYGGSILDRDWISVGGGDGTYVWPDPLDPNPGCGRVGSARRGATITDTSGDDDGVFGRMRDARRRSPSGGRPAV